MNRKEEIKEAAKSAIMYDDFEDGCIGDTYFQIGAKWADKTMVDNICQWIREKAEYNKNLFYNAYLGNVDFLIDEFKNDMEECL